MEKNNLINFMNTIDERLEQEIKDGNVVAIHEELEAPFKRALRIKKHGRNVLFNTVVYTLMESYFNLAFYDTALTYDKQEYETDEGLVEVIINTELMYEETNLWGINFNVFYIGELRNTYTICDEAVDIYALINTLYFIADDIVTYAGFYRDKWGDEASEE